MTAILLPTHPVLGCSATMHDALDAVVDVGPLFMSTSDKRTALLDLSRVAARLDELRLRVLGSADDVARTHGARDAGAWLAHEVRLDDAAGRRELALARDLDRRPYLAAAMRDGRLDRARASVVARALDELPRDVPAATVAEAERHLTAEGERFSPVRLRRLGRKVLEVVAPEVADHHERRMLEAEDARAEAVTRLTTLRRGDGTTDIRIRVADAVADRLVTYLSAFVAPRRSGRDDGDPRPWPQRLGHAFGALLETADPDRMPVHGGAATTVVVTIDLESLRTGLGIAAVGEQPVSAAQARRLACTAGILPAVLGGRSEVLDLGRRRRLFSTAQRRAMAIRDGTCRAEGCEIPAPWCEAHHAGAPWSRGGATDLDDGVLLCSHHHHRAHDHRYETTRLTDGTCRFRRRSPPP